MKKTAIKFSPKDTSYIKDMFNWHLITAKKIEYYLSEVEDEKIQKLFTVLCEMHYKHCATFIKILENGDAK